MANQQVNKEMGLDENVNVGTAIITGIFLAIPFVVAILAVVSSPHP